MAILPSKPQKPWPRILFAGSLALLFLSGCVYFRLLEVKRHLSDFDNHFGIEGDKDWIVVCKTPVMMSKDMIYLIGAPPLKTEDRGEIIHWRYEFQRVRAPEDKEQHPMDELSLDMEMLNGKMYRFIVPISYTQLFSHRVLTELLRSTPNAEVLELKKTLLAKIRLTPEADAELPTREKTLALLGSPLQIIPQGKLETYIYRYRIVGDENNVPIIARLSFSSDGLLRRTVVHWDTSSADAEFIRPTDY